MGKNIARKALCMILALSLVLGTAAMAFAAGSPNKNLIPKETATYVKTGGSNVAMKEVTKNQKALLYDGKVQDPKTKKWYKVTKINAGAFSKATKLKVLKIKWKHQVTVDKKAFKGLSKKQIKKIKVKAAVKDRENKKLTYVWEVLKEATITATGGAYEPRPDRVGEVVTTTKPTLNLKIDEPGAYRVYLYALDGTGYASATNLPILVK